MFKKMATEEEMRPGDQMTEIPEGTEGKEPRPLGPQHINTRGR